MQEAASASSHSGLPPASACAGDAGRSRGVWFRLLVAVVFVAAVVAWVHSPVLKCQALSFDDDEYLTLNKLVTNPSWASTRQFFVEVLQPSTVSGYYQPLAMTSLMLDYAAGGRPDHLRPFHRTGLLLHVISAALVVVLLFQLTHHAGLSALGGLLFGLHPAATEVIPWIAQRKTLLATAFALGVLIAYVSWAQKRTYGRLALCLLLYVLALLSKPTALPLVAVLIVLDWWPLSRFNRKTLVEKAPFVFIAALFAVITVISQSRSGTATSSVEESIGRPLMIIGFTTSFYLRQILWPVGWPGYYVFPEPFTLGNPIVLTYVVATIVLALVLAFTLQQTRAWMAGAVMFFALLSPTLGVIGFTDVIAANRFLYLPMIVLLIPLCLVWGRQVSAPALSDHRRTATLVLTVLVGAGLCIGEAVASRAALGPWRNSLVLTDHLTTAAPTSPKVRYAHGNALGDAGRLEEAVNEYKAAIVQRFVLDQAHNNLAITLDALGRDAEASYHFRQAIALNPSNARAQNSFGAVLLRRGALNEAIEHLREARRLDPDLADAAFNLGAAMMDKEDWSAAAEAFADVIRLAPNDDQALARLGYVYERLDRSDEAIACYLRVLSIDPANKLAAKRLSGLRERGGP